MVDAKQCDFSGEFYVPGKEQKYIIVDSTYQKFDIGPTLYSKILQLLEGKKEKDNKKILQLLEGKKEKDNKKKWSKEAKQKASERMKKRQSLARQIKDRNPELTWQESYREATNQIKGRKAHERNFSKIEKQEYKCAMCGQHKVKGPNTMCEECEKHFGQTGEIK